MTDDEYILMLALETIINLKNNNNQNAKAMTIRTIGVLSKRLSNELKICRPVRSRWRAMVYRCTNPKMHNYKYYGGRGIKVQKLFKMSFVEFYRAVGPRPSNKHSIDRVDNNRGYFHNNLRWATAKEQANNRRQFHTSESFVLNGSKITYKQAAQNLIQKYPDHVAHQSLHTVILTLRARIARKWPVEKAFTTKIRIRA